MTNIQPHYLRGLQSIERDVIAKLRDHGLPVNATDNIHWGSDAQRLVPPPVTATLRVAVGGKVATALFARETVEDYGSGQANMGIAATVDQIVQQLAD